MSRREVAHPWALSSACVLGAVRSAGAGRRDGAAGADRSAKRRKAQGEDRGWQEGNHRPAGIDPDAVAIVATRAPKMRS